MARRLYIQIATLLLFFVLTYTGVTKWMNFHHFSRSMLSQPLPSELMKMLIYLIPTTEIIAALLLIPNQTRHSGLWITSILMTVFTAYVLYIRFSSWENTICPCGGLFSKLNWNQHTWVNSTLTMIAITATLLNSNIFPGHGKKEECRRLHPNQVGNQ